MSVYPARIAIANRVLACFQPSCNFEMGFNRDGDEILTMRVKSWTGDGTSKTFPVTLRKDRHWFCGALGKKYPGGGGSTQAACTLACWIRGLPRLPLASWEYWSLTWPKGPGLLQRNPEAVGWLREANYDDEKTCCVKCGSVEFTGGLDWWSLNGVTGPCCARGYCAKATA